MASSSQAISASLAKSLAQPEGQQHPHSPAEDALHLATSLGRALLLLVFPGVALQVLLGRKCVRLGGYGLCSALKALALACQIIKDGQMQTMMGSRWHCAWKSQPSMTHMEGVSNLVLHPVAHGPGEGTQQGPGAAPSVYSMLASCHHWTCSTADLSARGHAGPGEGSRTGAQVWQHAQASWH